MEVTEMPLYDDDAIIAGRRAGMSWVNLGLHLRTRPYALRQYATTDLGLSEFLPGKEPNRQDREEIVFRSALPPGHPLTWGVISTVPYPKDIVCLR